MIFLDELGSFIGRFHPILVHLPIGMLVLAFMMALAEKLKKNANYNQAIRFSLLLGSIAAVFAGITGYLLSRNGGYEADVLDFHQWLGIAVSVFSLFTCWLYKTDGKSSRFNKVRSQKFVLLLVIVLLIGFTGHYGGTLTHGKGYIKDAVPTNIKAFLGIKAEEEEIAVLENVQEAQVYQEVIHPILKARCQSCHGEKKKEGGFALHTQESLLKGGDSGSLLSKGSKEKSELYARLILPEGHEDRMPPKGRTPITENQIKLIAWWIDSGLDFEKKVKEISQSEEIAGILKKLESAEDKGEVEMLYANLPEAPSLPENKINAWQAKGIKIMPISENNNYVVINAINYPELSDKDIDELMEIKDNIVQLKLGHTNITDKSLVKIASLPNLIRLHLEYSQITDKGLENLSVAKQLNYVNLVGTKITESGLNHLEGIKSLQHIYAFQTGGKFDSQKANSKIDTGNYTLPFLESDTVKY